MTTGARSQEHAVRIPAIKIAELRLVIKDIAVHEKNGRRWVQLPARPQIKDGRAVTDDSGKI